ncbi:MAG: response regulator transcription factor [Gemmatimonadota bacterium]
MKSTATRAARFHGFDPINANVTMQAGITANASIRVNCDAIRTELKRQRPPIGGAPALLRFVSYALRPSQQSTSCHNAVKFRSEGCQIEFVQYLECSLPRTDSGTGLDRILTFVRQIMSTRRILIVEDEADMAFGLHKLFESEGYSVKSAENAETAHDLLESFKPDVLILDLMLPGKNGFQFLSELRSLDKRTRVLVLTARAEHESHVRALSSGADDYVTKPFSTEVLLARVDVQFRRLFEIGTQQLIFGPFALNPARRQLVRDGAVIPLRPKEFDLLLFFLRNPRTTHSRKEILRKVWGTSSDLETRTVDTVVWELRKKLKDNREQYLRTVQRTGYCFDP